MTRAGVLPGDGAELDDPGWCVVLYSGECEEHAGLRCAIEVVYRPGMTSRQAQQVQQAVKQAMPGFCPHMVPVRDPALWEARP